MPPWAAGPSPLSRGAEGGWGGVGAAAAAPSGLPSCALRRRRSSSHSSWRWRPPQEPQVGAGGQLPPPPRRPRTAAGRAGRGLRPGEGRRDRGPGPGRTCWGRGGAGALSGSGSRREGRGVSCRVVSCRVTLRSATVCAVPVWVPLRSGRPSVRRAERRSGCGARARPAGCAAAVRCVRGALPAPRGARAPRALSELGGCPLRAGCVTLLTNAVRAGIGCSSVPPGPV